MRQVEIFSKNTRRCYVREIRDIPETSEVHPVQGENEDTAHA